MPQRQLEMGVLLGGTFVLELYPGVIRKQKVLPPSAVIDGDTMRLTSGTVLKTGILINFLVAADCHAFALFEADVKRIRDEHGNAIWTNPKERQQEEPV